jgi:GT2 family glycosyltransferase
MVTRNDDPGFLAEALDAVIAEGLEQPTIVVDMSTDDVVRRVCEERAPAVEYVAAQDSRGVSDSRNRVVERVTTRYLLFLDADAVPESGWAAAMRAAFDAVPDAAVVGARCVPRWTDRPPRLFTTPIAGDFLSLFDLGDERLEVPRIIGTSYAIDLERVPDAPFPLELGFGPDSALAGEENALCERAARDGWRVIYEPAAVVTHVIKPGRATWGSMLRRAYHAGQEARRAEHRHPPLPRETTPRDRLFQAAIAPAFAAGLAIGPPKG